MNEDNNIPFKDFLDDLAAESKANLNNPPSPPKKVDSVWAPLGTEAAQPKIGPKKVYPRKVQNKNALLAAFAAEYGHVVDWLARKSERSDFARSLQDFMIRTGTLTEKQIAAVERSIARDAEWAANRETRTVERVNTAPTVDVTVIETAFAKARENDVKTPKLNLGIFRFSLAPDHGVNAGAIYVKRIDNDFYLGKIKGGKFLKVYDCPDHIAAQVVEVASNPHEAAKAYGQRTGSCSVCGRTLTNHTSIDAKIGPICASKYGWR